MPQFDVSIHTHSLSIKMIKILDVHGCCRYIVHRSLPMTTNTIELTMRPMATAADAEAFRALNEEWISKWFRIEPKDAATLGDPQGKIVVPGGQVYVASDGEQVIATAALIRFGDGIFELSKMAVSPETRGQGIGRKLLAYVLEQARAMGAHMVFLGSSTKLKNAIHLYESLGFRHVAPSELPEMKYDRADVFMKMDLA
jgi:ribosomal protein S18 acetylase RimI-like enzyme